MRKFVILMIQIVAFITAIPAFAVSNAFKQLIYDKYESELEIATSARDSINIIYNMFDLSARKGQLKHGWQILDLSDRAADINAKTDMIRTLGTFYPGNDSVMNLLLNKCDEIPNKDTRASTKTYLLNQYFARKSRNVDDPTLQAMLLDSITKSHNLRGDDIYDELSVIYQIIMFLGIDAEGVLFRESLETYEELLDKLPMSDFPLKSQFNTTSAMIHSRLNGDATKAIQADRKMLDLISMLEKMYQKQNRHHRNYDVNRFISYRRMLSNYEGLTSPELEEIHDSLLAISERDKDVRTTIEKDGHPSGFYYMAKKDYRKAVPLLKTMFEAPYLTTYQRQKFYWMLMTASKEIGDTETYVDAMEHFIQSSMAIDSIKTQSIRKEILVRDSILPTPLLSNVANHGKKDIGQSDRGARTYMILSVVLALLLVVYMTLYFRLRLKQSTR